MKKNGVDLNLITEEIIYFNILKNVILKENPINFQCLRSTIVFVKTKMDRHAINSQVG